MKRNHLIVLLVALAICFLFACSNEQATEASAKAKSVPSVDYLANHADILAKEDKRCNELQPMDALQDPVCQNVMLAKKRHLSQDYLNKGPAPKKMSDLPQPK